MHDNSANILAAGSAFAFVNLIRNNLSLPSHFSLSAIASPMSHHILCVDTRHVGHIYLKLSHQGLLVAVHQGVLRHETARRTDTSICPLSVSLGRSTRARVCRLDVAPLEDGNIIPSCCPCLHPRFRRVPGCARHNGRLLTVCIMIQLVSPMP